VIKVGTNYYHRSRICECCGRYDERHICKSLVLFQGYRPDPRWPDDDYDGPLITSWAHWKAAILAEGEVWDEYGTKWDVDRFIADVEATDPDRRRRQYDWVQDDRYHRWTTGDRYWLDGDGFSFCDLEFS
jgi:hypothetical protein